MTYIDHETGTIFNDPKASPSFPVGKCKHCGKKVPDAVRDGKTILFCSYECYCLD